MATYPALNRTIEGSTPSLSAMQQQQQRRKRRKRLEQTDLDYNCPSHNADETIDKITEIIGE